MKLLKKFAVCLFGCISLVGISHAMPAKMGQNLIVNGNAESDGIGSRHGADVIPGWVTQQQGVAVVAYGSQAHLPSIQHSQQIHGGRQFFAGGTMKDTVLEQFIDLSDYSSWIDQGIARFVASGWFGGLLDKNDAAGVSFTFLNAQQDIVSYRLGDIDAFARHGKTGFVFQDLTELIPIGATQLMVTVGFNQMGGDYNHGYADNLFFSVNVVPAPASWVLVLSGFLAAAALSTQYRPSPSQIKEPGLVG
ncbi:hypothetical protein HNQ59_000511 [Chitinivorax tropicus]|uniref:PEP-CTERM sorting domain-containing protein n=1 Tax=Chitinivorax tropicus TaxID=714531 RepID=A0A840MJ86_9PROT|nr:hypothetical protein [Chitinivorax tropicus]MBB5017249.1 hypothetical protein [Chitinivorax tropicus]